MWAVTEPGEVGHLREQTPACTWAFQLAGSPEYLWTLLQLSPEGSLPLTAGGL